MDRRDFLKASALLAGCSQLPLSHTQHWDIKAALLDPITGQVAYQIGQALNPTLLVQRGQTISAHFHNNLPQPSTIHWHGLSTPASSDGAGWPVVLPQASYRYHFEVDNPAGLYWYHPHPHAFTAEQVYHGLGGMLLVTDAEDRALSQQLGTVWQASELALNCRDTRVVNGQALAYTPSLDDCLTGFMGNTVLVNGVAQASHSLSPGWLRLRLLNSSSARAFLLQFQLGQVHLPLPLPFYLIGTDGGLLREPIEQTACFIYPGERVDIALDASKFAGQTIQALSAAFEPRHQHVGHTPSVALADWHTAAHRQWPSLSGQGRCLPNSLAMPLQGEAMGLFTLNMTHEKPRSGSLPKQLSSWTPDSADGLPVRRIQLGLGNTGWQIDDDPKATIQVKRNSREIWEIKNTPVGMPHPMHCHRFFGQVLSRRATFGPARELASFSERRLATDLGRKDTVVVWPGETVRVLLDFQLPTTADYAGTQRYMFHCHNLEHEDGMMMLPLEVI